LPFLCLFLQPPVMLLLQRWLSLRQIIQVTFLANALPWLLVLLFPHLGPERDWVFAGISFLTTLANALCGVAWSAAMSQLVPLGIRGTFFGTRNMMFGCWTLLVVLVAGKIVDHYENSVIVFGWIFAAGTVARLLGLFFFTRMQFPVSVTARCAQAAPLHTF